MKILPFFLTTLALTFLGLNLSANYQDTLKQRDLYTRNTPIFVKKIDTFSYNGNPVSVNILVNGLWKNPEGLPTPSFRSNYNANLTCVGLLPYSHNAEVVVTLQMPFLTLTFITDIKTIIKNDKNILGTVVMNKEGTHSISIYGKVNYMKLNIPGLSEPLDNVLSVEIFDIQNFKHL